MSAAWDSTGPPGQWEPVDAIRRAQSRDRARYQSFALSIRRNLFVLQLLRSFALSRAEANLAARVSSLSPKKLYDTESN